MAVSPWLDDLQDDPDNYLIVTRGEMRLANRIPSHREPFETRPAWMNDVLRYAQGRQGLYQIQEVFAGTDVISADNCALAHADNGEQGNQLWNGSTTEASDPSAPVCRELIDGGEADPGGEAAATYRNLDYAPSGFMTAGHMTGDVRGVAYAAWFLPVRDNLGPEGVLDTPDPTAYGYPEDAEIEWEDDHPDLLGIEWADGDPVSIDDPTSAPFLNKWAVNFPGAGGTWIGGTSTPWQLGWPISLPDEVSETRPEMLWFYDLGIEGEDGVAPEDIWHPMPNSAGWDDHGWNADYDYVPDVSPSSSDAMVAAWPDVTGTGINTPEVRNARAALRFVLRARRFRFRYAGDNPVTRQYPRDDGRGISSAPRLHPPTKANRLAGGYS